MGRRGYGVYGRARPSRLTDRLVLMSPDGFAGVARQAVDEVGVEWEPTEAERAYDEGLSTQIPVNPVVCVKGVSRAIGRGPPTSAGRATALGIATFRRKIRRPCEAARIAWCGENCKVERIGVDLKRQH